MRGSPVFEGQLGHLAGLAALLLALWASMGILDFETGSFLGLSVNTWAALAVADAIIHQVYVWFCWRSELHGKRLTRALGDRAFPLYKAGFAALIILRPLLAFALAWANRGTLAIDPWLGFAIGVIMLGFAIWLMVSVRLYFGFDRAFGVDHFDPAYRNAPLVNAAIFRLSPNAMYVFGFLALWAPAFLFRSEAALAVAAFSHGYIWVHFYCTEKPDMRRIYGTS